MNEIEPRIPSPAELPAVVDFLNRELRSAHNWSIAKEYPQVFSDSNRSNLRVIMDGEKVLAHSAINYLIIKNTMGLFKVAAIGSVVTASDCRNQGLSQKILQSCLEAAQGQGADFAILWTDLYDFYRKLDFELAGSEISAVIESPLPIKEESLRFSQGNNVDPAALLQLYSQHTVSSIRTLEDIRRYLTIPNTQLYTVWDETGKLRAFAVEGKGADLNGYLHEWAGDVPSLLTLINRIVKHKEKPITLIMSSTAENLLRHLKTHPILINEGYLGMIRPLNVNSIFNKVHRHARNLGISDFVLAQNEQGFELGRGEMLYQISDLKTLTKVLFGPIETSQSDSTLYPILPIPMWIWGWDSV